jgi:hypothetical protein
MQRREFIALVGGAAVAATDRGKGRSGWPESGNRWPHWQHRPFRQLMAQPSSWVGN